MHITKSICLLLSHLQTTHTTVRAIQYKPASRFLNSRCMANIIQLTLRLTSFLMYCLIAFYHDEYESYFRTSNNIRVSRIALIYYYTS